MLRKPRSRFGPPARGNSLTIIVVALLTLVRQDAYAESIFPAVVGLRSEESRPQNVWKSTNFVEPV